MSAATQAADPRAPPTAFRATVFSDVFAATKNEDLIDLPGLSQAVRTIGASSKAKLPLIKLATFGDLRTNNNSLRSDKNVTSITGVEADYDGEIISFDQAIKIATQAAILCIIYTSPSHTEDAPRWRVLCPFSKAHPPERRDAFMGRLNGLFGGIFSVESWTLSQAYYLGNVNGNPACRAVISEGEPIDLLETLDDIWLGRPGAKTGTEAEQGKARPVGRGYTPVSDARFEGWRAKILANVSAAPEQQKHHTLRAAARALGGQQAARGFSDEEAVGWLLDALPDTVKDWIQARSTALWGLAKGREQPFELEDRQQDRSVPRPPHQTKANGAAQPDPAEDDGRPAGNQDEPSTEDPPVVRQPKRRRVRGEIDDDTSPADGPTIRVVAGKLHITTSTAEDALIASRLPIYQRGDGLVQPVVREVPASHGRTTLAAGLGEMNTYSLVDLMCATAEYERYDARSKDWVRINPPAQIAQTLLSRQGKWRFPVVAGIITTPTLRPDGSLLTAPGYDAATRLYHVADPSLRLHPDVAAPSRDLAERALKVLETLLREFSFVSDVAKAVALSGIITPVVRGAMSVAPLHAVNAHAAGSGKSFLVDLISLISTGRICPVASAAPDEAETEKRIAGLLLAGYPIVSIDNCNGELGGDLLCQAIERPLIRIRRLGGSDIFEIESSVTLFATGNNLRVRGDMVRRSLVAELDPQMERPELRKFEHDPVAAILADRGRYVSACLIIVRAYILAGSPNKFDPIASFGGWSNLVRSALAWLGCADPALSMEAAREDDLELSELREMISVWRAAFGGTATTCKAAIAAMTEKVAKPDAEGEISQYAPLTEIRYPDLQPMFLQVAGVRGVVDAKKLGTWLKNREGKIVGKERFERDGMTDGAARWKLRSMGQNGNGRG